MAKRDFRREVTDKLIEIIESGDTLPWQKGWRNVAVSPFNPFSGSTFKKGNKFNLLFIQSARGSIDPRWMTMNQIQKAGYSLRKGAKGALVEFWNLINKDAESADDGVNLPDADVTKDADKAKPGVFSRLYFEFNGEDIIGLPELSYAEPSFNSNELVERLVAATGAVIEHRTVTASAASVITDAAFFSHSADTIVLPPKGAFSSEEGYYATLLHELVHWTGHHTRLNRRAEGEQRAQDSVEYAKEELRAEYGAALLTAMFAIDAKVENHASYLQAYLNVLRDDKNAIFRAASDVDGIVDYLFEFDPELRQILEGELLEGNVLSAVKPGDKPVNQADLGGLPDFGKSKGAETSVVEAEVISDPWAKYLEIIEKLYQTDQHLPMAYYQMMQAEKEQGRFNEFIAKHSEVITSESLANYAKGTFSMYTNSKLFVDVWKHYTRSVEAVIGENGVLAARLNDDQRGAFRKHLAVLKDEMATITDSAKFGSLENAKELAAAQAVRLWGSEELIPVNPDQLLAEIQNKWPELADDFVVPLAENDVAEPVTTEAVSRDRYNQIDDDDDFIPVPVFEGESVSSDEVVLSPLGNSLSYDSMQP